MDNALKATLLERKFTSSDYMEEMARLHNASIETLLEAIRYFYGHPPEDEDWHDWHQSDWPETWEKRAVPNFKGTQGGIEEGISYARKGDLSYIEGAAGELHSIFGNLDNMGWKWWDYTDPTLKERFLNDLVTANRMASNIYRTTAGYWRPGAILDDEITGPIDEQDLLRYLKPGEQP